MLELKQITKDYQTGDTRVRALRGISVTFRDREFVSILGQSGCGKTTLLNIIGGLDHYTTGDLVINGRSTKSYRDRDWDTYRNHSVGFVFQSYNLIPHQTVVANVEMALMLSGVGRAERRRRAEEALARVGLGDHLNKKPNQLSGGQMQRVAIARALVNDPEIILADEPTGALDTATSVEVMEILKDLSRDRLVIMVTHNPELAEQYSSRIVRIQDGQLVDDSRPCVDERLTDEQIQSHAVADAKKGKRSMGFASAIALSFTNLMTKKGRTFLTAFAGSIGIIGIALILSLSDGAQNYIKETEESTMGSYPLSIQETSVDLASLMGSMMGASADNAQANTSGEVESKDLVNDMVTSVAEGANENDMASIKAWLDTNPDNLDDYVTDIQYAYDTPLNVYRADTSDGAVQVNPATVMDALGISMGSTQTEMMSSMSGTGGSSYDVWTPLLDNADTWERDYDVVAGRMPESWDEVVVYVDKNDRISDYTLYALGLLNQDDLRGMMADVIAGRDVEKTEQTSYTYDDLMSLTFKLLPESAKYAEQADGTWADMSEDDAYMTDAVSSADTVRVVGIVRPSADNDETNWGSVLYTPELMQHLVEENSAGAAVAAQQASPDTDIFTGVPFPDDVDEEMTIDDIETMIAQMPEAQGQQISAYVDQMRENGMSDTEIASAFQEQLADTSSNATYDGNLDKLGVASLDEPYSIQIYPVDFDAKERVDQIIEDHNTDMENAGRDDEVIQYTDIVGTLMSSVTSIVNSLTYILIAFVAISLVVSSIMIGIITYISVLERTKEIGILRAIGASKKDVSRIFTAETFIIGLVSGLLGVGITVLLDFPVNAIIYQVAGVENLAAVPVGPGIALVVISVALSFIAGLAPSRMAAKKDPVTALRTE